MSEEARATQRPLIIVFAVISFAIGGALASVLAAGLQLGLGIAEGLVPSLGMRGQLAGLVVALGSALLSFAPPPGRRIGHDEPGVRGLEAVEPAGTARRNARR